MKVVTLYYPPRRLYLYCGALAWNTGIWITDDFERDFQNHGSGKFSDGTLEIFVAPWSFPNLDQHLDRELDVIWKLLTGSYCANRWNSDRVVVLTCDELRNRFVSDLGVNNSGGHAGVGDPPPCSPSCQRLWLAARDPPGRGSRVCGRPTWVQTLWISCCV